MTRQMDSVFRTRTFTRWMRKAGLTDAGLHAAVSEMVQGLVDADLGGHLVKKRIALAVGEIEEVCHDNDQTQKPHPE